MDGWMDEPLTCGHGGVFPSLITIAIVGCLWRDATDLWMGLNRGGTYMADP